MSIYLMMDKYIHMKEFKPETVKKKCVVTSKICKWLIKLHNIASEHMVGDIEKLPKKQKEEALERFKGCHDIKSHFPKFVQGHRKARTRDGSLNE